MGRDQLLLSEDGEKAEGEGRMKLLKQIADVDEEEIRAKYDDEVCFVRSMKHTRRVRMKGVQSHWFDRFKGELSPYDSFHELGQYYHKYIYQT